MASKNTKPKESKTTPVATPSSGPLMLDLPDVGGKPGEEKKGAADAPKQNEPIPSVTPTPNQPELDGEPVAESPKAPEPVEELAKTGGPSMESVDRQEPPAPRKQAVQLSFNTADNPMAVLEAALFMSGQAIGAAELARLVGIAALGHVNDLLQKLSAKYDSMGSAIEVVQENGKWVMRVRAAYAASVRNVAGEAEISRHALRTLSYINQNNGIKKRDLYLRLGSTIYEDVAELLEKGFVSATPSGRTVSLKTTAKFKQYFEGG